MKHWKNPKQKMSAEQEGFLAQSRFMGMLKGEVPLTEIPREYSYRLINMYGFREWADGRPGTKEFSRALIPGHEFTVDTVNDELDIADVGHRWLDGDPVKVYTTGTLPSPLEYNTVYYVIYVDDVTIQLATTYDNAIAGTAIVLTTAGTGTHTIRYSSFPGAVCDHVGQARVMKLYGRHAFVAEKRMDSWEKVVNLSSADPNGAVPGRAVEDGEDILLAAGGLYRVVLDGDFYYMYQINSAVPNVILTDVNESAALTYLYRYYYAMARIEGEGNRNRITDETELVLETGTCIDPNQEKRFGEVAFADGIGDDLTNAHVIEYLTCPLNSSEMTHFPLYRTLNIGENSGGEVNDQALYIWVDDVPVCKALDITVAGNVATAVNGTFVIGDVGCTLRSDEAGTRTGEIESYVDPNTVNLVAGHTLNAADTVAIGEGRVMTVSQTGTIVTRTAGDTFDISDEGRTLYCAGGPEIVLQDYVDANTMRAAISQAVTARTATIQKTAGTYAYRRKWNDTVLDDGKAVGQIGLTERFDAQDTLYIPHFNYRPHPSCDIVLADSGFVLTGLRGDPEWYYSAIGDERQIAGQYRANLQKSKLPTVLSDILMMPGLAIFISPTRMFNLALNVPTPNVGDENKGEVIPKLPEPNEVATGIGVAAWTSIWYINKSEFIALTQEPAIRTFNGHDWSDANYAIDLVTGFPAVMDDLQKIDQFYALLGWFSYFGGYKIAASKWEES